MISGWKAKLARYRSGPINFLTLKFKDPEIQMKYEIKKSAVVIRRSKVCYTVLLALFALSPVLIKLVGAKPYIVIATQALANFAIVALLLLLEAYVTRIS